MDATYATTLLQRKSGGLPNSRQRRQSARRHLQDEWHKKTPAQQQEIQSSHPSPTHTILYFLGRPFLFNPSGTKARLIDEATADRLRSIAAHDGAAVFRPLSANASEYTPTGIGGEPTGGSTATAAAAPIPSQPAAAPAAVPVRVPAQEPTSPDNDKDDTRGTGKRDDKRDDTRTGAPAPGTPPR